MSILVLAQSQPPEPPQEVAVALVTVNLVLSALSPVIAWASGLFRRESVAGPARFGPGDSFLWFLLAMLAALGAGIFGAGLAAPLAGHTSLGVRVLVAGMLSFLMALAVFLVANARFRPRGLSRAGLTPEGVGPGFVSGLLGLLVVMPWLFWLMVAAQALIQKYGLELPTEHEVFRMWREPEVTPAFKVLAVVSAVILAPLAEEAVFRGLLQTGLSLLFGGRTAMRQPPPLPPNAAPGAGEPAAAAPPAALDPDTTGFPPPVLPNRGIPAPPSAPPAPSPGARWAAIVVTSILFAFIHQPWTIQIPIFLLSLGLGYIYERTGNLWSPIFMHLLFNALQFGLFVLVAGY